MALFSIGVMKGTYISEEMLYGQVLKPFMQNYGLGWGCTDIKSKDIAASHSGSNGAPKAYLLIKPREKTGFCLLATQKLFDEGNRLRGFIVYLKSLLDEL